MKYGESDKFRVSKESSTEKVPLEKKENEEGISKEKSLWIEGT